MALSQYAMIIIFEDGTVEVCKVQERGSEWVDIYPLSENNIIISDFKLVCSTKDELIEEMRANYPHIDYITIKLWKTMEDHNE